MNELAVKALVSKYQLSVQKALGQNFLIDESIASAIIKAAAVDSAVDVVEIGPGLGVLTRPLLAQAKSLLAYEIDESLVTLLQQEINSDQFELVNANVLLVPFAWAGKRRLVSNMPYHITSELLFKIFANAARFDCAVLMMQKEVVMRLLAQPGASDYSRLTLTATHFASAELITLVPATAFWPAPAVDSAVVKLVFKPVSYEASLPLLNFIDRAFSQRRKTLVNNLKAYYDLAKLTLALTTLQLPLLARAQELSYHQFVTLFELLEQG